MRRAVVTFAQTLTPKSPDTIWSMDSRAGAISEAEMATGDLNAARKLATHSSPKTTLRYVRNGVLENNRATAQARRGLSQ